MLFAIAESVPLIEAAVPVDAVFIPVFLRALTPAQLAVLEPQLELALNATEILDRRHASIDIYALDARVGVPPRPMQSTQIELGRSCVWLGPAHVGVRRPRRCDRLCVLAAICIHSCWNRLQRLLHLFFGLDGCGSEFFAHR